MVPPKEDPLKAWHGEDWHTPRSRLVRDIAHPIDAGLITTVAFLAGVSALIDDSAKVVLAGLAQISAGAIAIFFGAYISTKAQKDFFENQIKRERTEIERLPEKETQEIRDVSAEYGFSPEEQEVAVKRITVNKDLWLKFMVQEEIGISPSQIDRPLSIGGISTGSFLVGALPVTFPFFVIHEVGLALLASAIIILVFLFVVGVWKTRLTKLQWLLSGIETLTIGGLTCALGFIFGKTAQALL